MLSGIAIMSCYGWCLPIEQRASDWSSWNKYNDCPGIEYRSTCLGQKYPGSKFSSCKVELFNEYTMPVNLEMTLTDLSGEQVSEIYMLKVRPENSRNVIFYNVGLDCGNEFKIDIKEVQFL